jgi:glycosyltransferase involved in cell wall biosynthesis
MHVRAELGVGPGDLLLLAVGNLYPVKGHSILLKAVSELSPCAGRVVVAMAGTGPEESNLRTLARDLGIEQDVHLLGYRADVTDLLESADVFVMPSLSEGLPMAMIEAMLARKAIVASDAGGIRELIPSSEFGVLVQPGDAAALTSALADVLRDRSLRERIGTAAHARAVERFTASAMADAYLPIYSG